MIYIAYRIDEELILDVLTPQSWERLKRAGYDSLNPASLKNIYDHQESVCGYISSGLDLANAAALIDIAALRFSIEATDAILGRPRPDLFKLSGLPPSAFLIVFLRQGDPNLLVSSASDLARLDDRTLVYGVDDHCRYEISIGDISITVLSKHGELKPLEVSQKADSP